MGLPSLIRRKRAVNRRWRERQIATAAAATRQPDPGSDDQYSRRMIPLAF